LTSVFLDAFAKQMRKPTIRRVMSVRFSLYLTARKSAGTTGWISVKFRVLGF